MCENYPTYSDVTAPDRSVLANLFPDRNDEALTLEEVENRIAGIYRFFAAEAPGVHAQEQGELGELWRIADDFYAAEEGAE